MGKRSDFERNERDYYPTPAKAVPPLIPFIDGARYIEPCCGDGRLIAHIRKQVPSAKCVYAGDVTPQEPSFAEMHVVQRDMFLTDWQKVADETKADMFVTNPPWLNSKDSGYMLQKIIHMLSSVRPTWLLMNGNFVFNKKSARSMKICSDIVPVGRLKWIENSPHTGKEDCAWFRFDSTKGETQLTYVHPREI